jgi:hypothetical protein
VVSRDPDTFHHLIERLSNWHLVLLSAGPGLTRERVQPLLPKLQATVQVWPWLAALKAVHAVAPDFAAILDYRARWSRMWALARVWWMVRIAAAEWTVHLKMQRRRDVRMFFIGAATVVTMLTLIVIVKTLQ